MRDRSVLLVAAPRLPVTPVSIRLWIVEWTRTHRWASGAGWTVGVLCAQPFVTGAVFPFGEIAECFGEWKFRSGHAIIWLAQRLLVCPRQNETARKSLRQGEAVETKL